MTGNPPGRPDSSGWGGHPIPYRLTAAARPIPFRLPWYVAKTQLVADLFDREGGGAVEQRPLHPGKRNSPRS
jgi:hypothetical protein